MKKIKILIWLVSFIMAFVACDEYGDLENVMVSKEPVNNPTPVWMVTGTETELPPEGGTLTFDVQCSDSWTVACPAWCTWEKAQDDTKAIVTAPANNTGTARSGSVTFSTQGKESKEFVVTQQPQTNQQVDDVPGPDDNVPPNR